MWADKLAYGLSLWISGHWLDTTLILVAFGIAGSLAAGPLIGASWAGVDTFLACYGVLLAIGIFTWTLAGFSAREADAQKGAAGLFATHIGERRYGPGELSDWHCEKLATVLRVPGDQVEDELLLWVVEQSTAQGPKEVLVITNRLWFLRLVGRGRGGKQVLDLATGKSIA